MSLWKRIMCGCRLATFASDACQPLGVLQKLAGQVKIAIAMLRELRVLPSEVLHPYMPCNACLFPGPRRSAREHVFTRSSFLCSRCSGKPREQLLVLLSFYLIRDFLPNPRPNRSKTTFLSKHPTIQPSRQSRGSASFSTTTMRKSQSPVPFCQSRRGGAVIAAGYWVWCV